MSDLKDLDRDELEISLFFGLQLNKIIIKDIYIYFKSITNTITLIDERKFQN